MAIARLKMLEKEEEELVHEQSIRCLQEIGVLIRSEMVLEILEDAGAEVDFQHEIAKIPETMVEEAIRIAPKEIRLCARDPENDVIAPVESHPKISTNGLSIYMTDLETGEKRDTTRADLADFARLADYLDAVSFFWPQVTASDVPQHAHVIHEMWTSVQNCTKHIQGDTVSAYDARAQIDLASLIVGGDEALRKRPIISVTLCPIAPLSFEKGSVEAQVEFAKAGLPISSLSMSLSGLSSPITLAGTMVNANSENLASLVITQFSSPGAPHIYGSESTPIDMSTGTIDYFAPEVPLISAGLAQMAKRYGRPCFLGQWGVNGMKPGIPVSFSELYSMAVMTLSGTDFCSGMGGLESAKGASLEQMVIDAYLWEHCRSLLREFVFNDETISLDVMREVGQGNSFLTHPHTAENFRKELFFRDKRKMRWEATLSTEMVSEARDTVKSILKDHEVPPIDRDILSEGEELLKRYESDSCNCFF